jgi:hypothetical protein
MDIVDLRGISSLMGSQQVIKMNNSYEWIDMVTKTEKLQIFWKPHKLASLDGFSKPIILEHTEAFNFQECPLVYLIYTSFEKSLSWHDKCQVSLIKV